MKRHRTLLFVVLMGSLAAAAVVAIVFGPRQVETGGSLVAGVERFGAAPSREWAARVECPDADACGAGSLMLVATVNVAEDESWVSRDDGKLRVFCVRLPAAPETCLATRRVFRLEHGEEAAVYMTASTRLDP